MGLSFEDLPRYWFGGDPVRTHLVNGLHFVFPAGERFFIRAVRHYEAELPGELEARVRAFYGQEAHHQAEHLRAFAAIEAQGYEIRSFLDWYEQVAYEAIEQRVPPHIRLATTVALEHFTAILGELVLDSELLADAAPIMQQLLLWHAAEEIEHKSVTFDVLQHVDPRYSTRLVGFLIATLTLFYFWGVGFRHMMRQEAALPPEPVDEASAAGARRALLRDLSRLPRRVVDFFRPSFHPDDHDTYHLASAYLSSIGRLAA
jgi:predicted metal-dependent hydrolase